MPKNVREAGPKKGLRSHLGPHAPSGALDTLDVNGRFQRHSVDPLPATDRDLSWHMKAQYVPFIGRVAAEASLCGGIKLLLNDCIYFVHGTYPYFAKEFVGT